MQLWCVSVCVCGFSLYVCHTVAGSSAADLLASSSNLVFIILLTGHHHPILATYQKLFVCSLYLFCKQLCLFLGPMCCLNFITGHFKIYNYVHQKTSFAKSLSLSFSLCVWQLTISRSTHLYVFVIFDQFVIYKTCRNFSCKEDK